MRADTRKAARAAGGADNLVKSISRFRSNFFRLLVTDEWNSLPDNIKAAGTVAQFMRFYRRHGEKEDREQASRRFYRASNILIRAQTGPPRIISQVCNK